jgi:hypothetical protein
MYIDFTCSFNSIADIFRRDSQVLLLMTYIEEIPFPKKERSIPTTLTRSTKNKIHLASQVNCQTELNSLRTILPLKSKAALALDESNEECKSDNRF